MPQNILSICTDQQRRDSLGVYGHPHCRTPNIDSIAASGTQFTNAFTPTAICTAARASLLTGLWPHHHRLLANYERNVGYLTELPEELAPFSHYLREAGYRCANVGKWHIGERLGPEDYGFEGLHYPGWAAPVGHPDYVSYLDTRGLPRFRLRDEVHTTFPNGKQGILMAGIHDAPVEATYPYFLAERTIERLRELREDDRPFFVACNFFGPHLPYLIPQEYATMYDPSLVERHPSMDETFENKPRVHRSYSAHWGFESLEWPQWQRLIAANWGYVTLIDEQVGRLLATLDDLGLAGDTVVVFTTDHGAFVGCHRLSDKGPAMYDDIYRIPLLARWPGGPTGSVCEEFAGLLDLTPTFLELAGAPMPEHFDGRSLVPLLRGEAVPDWPQEIFAEFHGHHFPYPQRMIRTRTHKLVINPPDTNELYDLINDPCELRNLIDEPEHADIRRELMQRLYHRLRASGDNFYHWMTSTCEVETRTDDADLRDYSKGR